MTRLLILGSSHTGALRRADDRFRAAFPSIQTTYFAAPAPVIRGGHVDSAGIYHAGGGSKADRDLVMRLNGSLSVDLTLHDRVFVVSHRPTPLELSDLVHKHDLLERAAEGSDRPLVSEAFVRAWLAREVGKTVTSLVDLFGVRANVTFATGPFPAASVVERSNDLRLGRLMERFLAAPASQRVFDLWLQVTRELYASAGLDCLHQPAETLAGPFATRPEFAQGATDAAGEDLGDNDHRHMNADFGYLMLDHLARTRLNVKPKVA